jgi:error-prone DNA polymerase
VTDYAELHCLSNFTFLRGASQAEELVERAVALGYRALAITDECSLAGVVRAHLAARDLPIQLIIGSEFRLADGLHLVLLARDRAGYAWLVDTITRGRRAAEKGAYHLERSDLRPAPIAGIHALWVAGQDADRATADWLRGLFGSDAVHLAVHLHAGGQDRARLAAARAQGLAFDLPLCAAGDVHMHARGRRALQDTLTAIRLHATVATAGYGLFPNGERHLRPRETLARLYPPELLAATLRIAAECRFSLDELRYEYPDELVPAGHTPASWLRALTEQGMRRRWPLGAALEVATQIETELRLITELRYEPFFLTVHDVVAFARRQGILCQGRGSAANSAVCYCLGITEVDPARMSMLFERFLSRERDEPPDIDVDFEHTRREEVIQYMYAKYGRHRAALAATVITWQPRSAVREVGKALGFAPAQVDRLASVFQWWDGRRLREERLREAGFDPANPMVRRLMVLVQTLLGFPRHLSQHVGGFVIARHSLADLVPVENAAMDERTVIQWDKDDLDALGLLKVDILALGMLTAIRRTLDLVSGFRGARLGLADIPAEDPATYAMIQAADTVGVFQIESRAQMSMLPRLRPKTFYDLVIEVAIVRPGPIQGDMVHPYLRRRTGEEPVTYPSAAVRKVLARTLGIPIFQEQAMQLAVVAAGFTGGEADQLRRAMAAWRRKGGIGHFEAKLKDGLRERGYSTEFADGLYRQLQGFGDYGFPESHAASFALLVYVSSWLKRHEPAAFLAGLLDSQPMGFYAPAQLVQDAQRHGVEVRPVCVQRSDWDCALERREDGQPAVRLGLRLTKGLDEAAGRRVVTARRAEPFRSATDLAERAQLQTRELELLAAADALAGLGGHRHRARWAVAGVEAPLPVLGRPEFTEATPLLATPTEGEALVADYAHLGLTLGRHPLALLREHLRRLRTRTSIELAQLPDGAVARVAGLVINRQRPGTASGVTFMTLEDEGGSINVIVWRDLAEQQRQVLIGARLMLVVGRLQREGEVQHLIASRLEDHSRLLGRLTHQSRDFH